MDEGRFTTLLAVMTVPQTVDLIMKEQRIGSIEAVRAFYRSKTYDVLSRQDTAVWHFSPLTLYNMWLSEMETGEIDFPEECRCRTWTAI